MTSPTKLKPCPFCGNEGTLRVQEDFVSGGYNVVCHVGADGCGGGSGCYETPEAAQTAWNKRKVDDVLRDGIKRYMEDKAEKERMINSILRHGTPSIRHVMPPNGVPGGISGLTSQYWANPSLPQASQPYATLQDLASLQAKEQALIDQAGLKEAGRWLAQYTKEQEQKSS